MAKYLPHGTTFTFNAQAVGGLTSIGIPDRTRGVAETTASDSAFNRAFIAGLRDPGTVQLTFRHDPGDVGQVALSANFGLDTSANLVTCIIELPAAAGTNRTYTFTGFVISPPKGDLGLTDDTAAEQSATIQVVGLVAIT
jgi:hypothetical protein